MYYGGVVMKSLDEMENDRIKDKKIWRILRSGLIWGVFWFVSNLFLEFAFPSMSPRCSTIISLFLSLVLSFALYVIPLINT